MVAASRARTPSFCQVLHTYNKSLIRLHLRSTGSLPAICFFLKTININFSFRTIFCMQLSQRCRARDLEDFMSSVGKVRCWKQWRGSLAPGQCTLLTCNNTWRFVLFGPSWAAQKTSSVVVLAGSVPVSLLTHLTYLKKYLTFRPSWPLLCRSKDIQCRLCPHWLRSCQSPYV